MDTVKLIWEVFQVLIPFVLAFIIWYIKVKMPILLKHYYDTKISELKNKLDLEKKEIENLQNNALKGAEKREEILFKHKLNVCEDVWKEILRLYPIKNLANYFRYTKEDLTTYSLENKNGRDYVVILGQLSNIQTLEAGFKKEIENIEKNNISLKRLYMSEKLYSLYLLYSLLCTKTYSSYLSMKEGNDFNKFIDNAEILNMVKILIPKYNSLKNLNFIKTFEIMEIVEVEILNEIKNIHSGIEENKTSIETSRKIIEEVSKINKDIIKNKKMGEECI